MFPQPGAGTSAEWASSGSSWGPLGQKGLYFLALRVLRLGTVETLVDEAHLPSPVYQVACRHRRDLDPLHELLVPVQGDKERRPLLLNKRTVGRRVLVDAHGDDDEALRGEFTVQPRI